MSGQSFGEKKTIEILNKYGIKYTKEKTFNGLRGKGNGKLRFDFYILSGKRNFLLEIDGQQHFNETSWGGNTKEHDIIKNQFCTDRGIPLHRIKYDGKLDKLEKRLLKILNDEFGDNSLIEQTKVPVRKMKLTREEKNKYLSTIKESLEDEKSCKIDPSSRRISNIEIKTNMAVKVKVLKWLVKKNGINRTHAGVIKVITEKAILLEKDSGELWLPKYAIKIYEY